MTDDSSLKSLNALEDWEMTQEQKTEIEVKKRIAEEKLEADKDDREKHLMRGWMWYAPWPHYALALFYCQDSGHHKEGYGDDWIYYWIAVRETADGKAFELVRVEVDDNIVENYPGRYETLFDAKYAAASLSQNWDDSLTDMIAHGMKDEREVSRNLKLNPWGRAVWERKHPAGPVLVVWQLEPLWLFVAGWLPFAGSRCVPTPVLFGYESDPSRINAMVDTLAEDAYGAGPSDKMIARAKSIAASYAANGRKGGRPKKKQKDGQAEG